MRIPGAVTVGLAALGLALIGSALGGCGDDSDPGEPAPTPAAPTSSPTAPPTGTVEVADCVVGDWRSTEVSGEIGDGVAGATVNGGGGVALTVGPDGAANLDFSGSEPVGFTGQVAGADVAGDLTYDGPASGTIRTGAGTSGSWEPVGEVDWSGVRVTVDLSEPTEGRLIEDMPLGDVLDEADQAANQVVDVDPLLAEGSFSCQDDTLELGPDGDDPGMTWTLTRT